ncbi:hypothetical protein EBB59_05850 [Lysobacter pythonis]|uniref:DUF4124 domain-containing protein n=1 Tax=Solilutibacter pythonis TaxID=2483112 RepID=A0A3M2I1A6_9GAMM|nr:hypothetical protein [Lysobacter pythonis]RMH93399.1 hypothetical protein EBB59_05850 [Lysobacter pythonis]
MSRCVGAIIILLLTVAPPLVATELRKCALAGGGHAYVSGDCPAGSRLLWQRGIEARVDADDLRERRQDTARWREMNRMEVSAALRARPARVSARRAHRGDTAARRCERAQQRRSRTRERDFMQMTYDQAVALDRRVADACR